MDIRQSILVACSLLLVAGCEKEAPPSAATASVQPDRAAAEAEVRSFVEQYNSYYAANDLDKYFASFAPELTQWFPTGRADLKGYEASWREGVANGGGVSKAVVSDLRVQVDPTADAAVATYVLEVTPRVDGQAQSSSERYQETDVLFKHDAQWKIVHVNYSPARTPE